jgi:hypothetical protein
MEISETIKKQIKTHDIDKLNLIIKDIIDHVGKDNILVYSTDDWALLNKTYDKEEIRDALVIAITQHKIGFPFEVITMEDVNRCFRRLLSHNIEQVIQIPEAKEVEVDGDLRKRKVIEKYDDFKYTYEDTGICIINSHHTHNDVSDYFHQKARHRCGTWSRPSTLDAWETGEGLRSALGALWRMGNDHIDRKKLKSVLRLSTYIAAQFKPLAAKALYQGYGANKIIDISCGWGDRLAGFYTTNTATEYYGFDPNPVTFENYKKQCLAYEKILGNPNPEIIEDGRVFRVEGIKKVIIQNLPAEDANYELIPDDIDFVFSSPPYFATEKYGAGGDDEDNQSWKRYGEYENWRENFLFNVMDKCWAKMKQGKMCINIVDVIVKGERCRICDEMVDYMKTKSDCTFDGQIGLKLNLRPNTRNDEVEASDINVVPFIEPMWVFNKAFDERCILQYNKPQDIEDLFE